MFTVYLEIRMCENMLNMLKNNYICKSDTIYLDIQINNTN